MPKQLIAQLHVPLRGDAAARAITGISERLSTGVDMPEAQIVTYLPGAIRFGFSIENDLQVDEGRELAENGQPVRCRDISQNGNNTFGFIDSFGFCIHELVASARPALRFASVRRLSKAVRQLPLGGDDEITEQFVGIARHGSSIQPKQQTLSAVLKGAARTDSMYSRRTRHSGKLMRLRRLGSPTPSEAMALCHRDAGVCGHFECDRAWFEPTESGGREKERALPEFPEIGPTTPGGQAPGCRPARNFPSAEC